MGAVIAFFDWFGRFGTFCVRLARSALTPPYEFRELVRQCDSVGAKSLPLVALAGAATGIVMAMETRDSLARFGATGPIGPGRWMQLPAHERARIVDIAGDWRRQSFMAMDEPMDAITKVFLVPVLATAGLLARGSRP